MSHTIAACEKTIYLVRHGALEAAGEGKRFIGQLDLPLSEDGVCQGKILRDRLKDRPLTAIYCSDLQRSLEIARIIAEPHRLEPRPLSSLREINLGGWEGRSFAEIKLCYPEAFEERGRDIIHFRPPAAESFLDCMQRVIPVWHNLLKASSGDIAVVGHKGVNRIILCAVSGWSLDRIFEIPQDYGCLNEIRYEDSAGRIVITNG